MLTNDKSFENWTPLASGGGGAQAPEFATTDAFDELIQEVEPVDLRNVVSINTMELHEKVDVVTSSLAKLDPPAVFASGPNLVRIVSNNGSPHIDHYSVDSLATVAARNVRFVKTFKTGTAKVDPPPGVIRSVMSDQNHWEFKELGSISNIPVLRDDYTLVTQPGYDEMSRVFYDPDPRLSMRLPEQVKEETVVKAIRVFREDLFRDTNFAADADFANTLTLLLTPIIRTLVKSDKVPCFPITGNQPGAGKGTVIEIAHIIATGEFPAMYDYPDREEEIGKIIVSHILSGAGAGFITFDNVARKIYSPTIQGYVTAGRWHGRMLGTNSVVKPVTKPAMIFTGNNLRVRSDIAQRSVPIMLLAQEPRHFEQKFVRARLRHSDVLAYASESRARFLKALYILVLWWVQNGRPIGAEVTRFNEWSGIVSGICSTAGIEGFLGNRGTFALASGEEESEWGAWLAAWWGLFEGREVRGAEIGAALIKAAACDGTTDNPHEAFADMIPERLSRLLVNDRYLIDPAGMGREAGKVLAHEVEHRYEYDGFSYHLKSEKSKKHKAKVWRVERKAC